MEAAAQKTMTDDERIQLAEKLDKELDDYINSLEKKPYTDGWPEDRWEEEMEKHPFFMTKSPEVGTELPPLLEGIQQLKYDENENTPEELAVTYKEDGNFNFKCKKYRVAVISYTEGLRQKCSDSDLNAQLYNNRAAAHFFLKNYRSCLKDCYEALKLKKPYPKAQSRAAQCCFYLGQYDECINICDEILLENPSERESLNLRAKAVSALRAKERNTRKEAAQQRKVDEEEKKLLEAIKGRGIRIEKTDKDGVLSLSALEPQCPENYSASRVHFIDERLAWPVMFLYPEYQVTDFVREFPEDCSFEDMLSTLFESPPEWDVESKYKVPSLSVYYEDLSTGCLQHVSSKATLLEVLSEKKFLVRGGTPAFIVFVAGSDVEQKYMNS